MKFVKKSNDSVIIESLKSNDKISSLEKYIAKSEVSNSENDLLKQLNSLNLEDKDDDSDDNNELIERGPIKPKDSKENKTKPYQPVQDLFVNRFVSNTLNCGGFSTSPINFKQPSYYNNRLPQYNITESYSPPQCSECRNFFDCNVCLLNAANSSEFNDFLTNLQNEQTQSNITQPREITISNDTCNIKATSPLEELNDNTDLVFLKPQTRRYSYDSGFQSDSPSPQSDSMLSPVRSTTPHHYCKSTEAHRKILPKTSEMPNQGKTVASVTPKSKERQVKQEGKQIWKEMLRSTLNPEIKLVKWIEITVKKSDEEVFGVGDDGQTILEKLLRSDQKYIDESFYAAVEKIKQKPDKCSHIVKARSSICNAITQNKHPQLLLDYFCEALQIIKDKMNPINKTTN